MTLKHRYLTLCLLVSCAAFSAYAQEEETVEKENGVYTDIVPSMDTNNLFSVSR
ncbi:hypothetical protein AGMMS49944_23990 [Spirochaetia bacterium]|nr:hypothetical protein AGMMS49944_23990 [Spirochaetia bacterium]